MSPPSLLLEPEFLARLERLALLSRRLYRTGTRGERRSGTLGRGVEFADHRSYQAGDDFRYIDWNIASRLDRLFVKLFSEEEDVTLHLLVDVSRSMSFGAPSKLWYAVRTAAALGFIGLAGLDRVAVMAFSDRPIRILSPRRGRASAFVLFDFLSGLAPQGHSDLASSLAGYAARTRRRGVLVVISDLMFPEGVGPGLRAARYHRFEPVLLHLLSDEELVPAVAGDLRLVDSELGRAVDVTGDAAALAAYARARDAYFSGIERLCLRNEVEYIRATTSVPLDDLILRHMRATGLVA